jgi:hypothetical protein
VGKRFFVLTTIVSSPETQGILVVGAVFARPVNNFRDGAVFARPINNFRNADSFLCPTIFNFQFSILHVQPFSIHQGMMTL